MSRKLELNDVTEDYRHVSPRGKFKLIKSNVAFSMSEINFIAKIDGIDTVFGLPTTYSKYEIIIKINDYFMWKDILVKIFNYLRPNEKEEVEVDVVDSTVIDINNIIASEVNK